MKTFPKQFKTKSFVRYTISQISTKTHNQCPWIKDFLHPLMIDIDVGERLTSSTSHKIVGETNPLKELSDSLNFYDNASKGISFAGR